MKYRNELKYICTEAELLILESRIKHLCRRDSHVGESGSYNIRSIYFDDANDSCFKDNEAGTDPRAKFRIRIYDGDSGRISLEKKSKTHSMTNKMSVILTESQYNDILSGNPHFTPGDFSPLLNEFKKLIYTTGFTPKVIVAYNRTPFVYNAGNVRITFDRNIGHSTDIKSLFDESLSLIPVLPKGKHILEVKYDEFLPDFIYEALNLDNLIYTNFSKYYLSRRYFA